MRILLAGCGKMGGAMLDGWLDQGQSAADVTVVEPSDAVRASLAARGVGTVADVADVPAPAGDDSFDVVVLAVKPQVMEAAVPPYGRFVGPGTVFLSIAAGRSLAGLKALLGEKAAVARAMPNTPAAVRRSITVAIAGDEVDEAARARCTALLEAVGEVAWIEDEALMDAVTAVSGSGPAYVFWLTECLAVAGRRAGLPEDLAQRLAKATVAGAGALLYEAGQPPGVLRANVTSPGGTTAAALEELMDAERGLEPLLTRAVAAAARRSRELAG